MRFLMSEVPVYITKASMSAVHQRLCLRISTSSSAPAAVPIPALSPRTTNVRGCCTLFIEAPIAPIADPCIPMRFYWHGSQERARNPTVSRSLSLAHCLSLSRLLSLPPSLTASLSRLLSLSMGLLRASSLYRGTSLIRKRPPPEAPPRTQGTGLRQGPSGVGVL